MTPAPLALPVPPLVLAEQVDRPATLLAILAGLVVLSVCVDAVALVAARRARWSSIPKRKATR